jgi:CheY-like chemotaxis protein
VAILDIGLPVMDGYALGRELCALLPDAPPTLIAFTGYGRTEDKQRSREAHFAFHLVKPIESRVLLRLLDTLVD